MESVENINQQKSTTIGLIKAKTVDEFLVKMGAKEEFDEHPLANKPEMKEPRHDFFWDKHNSLETKSDEWDPKVTGERLRRSRSFICPEYHQPACYRRKPKTVLTDAWSCDSQACRQLYMQQRLGPKRFYINNPKVYHVEKFYLQLPKTCSLGICCYPQAVESL